MVIIQFPQPEMHDRALGYLLGRFLGKAWATGEIMVPGEALAHLVAEGIEFSVKGRPTYEQRHSVV